MGLLIDVIPNSPNKHNENCLQIVRRITNKILGVKELSKATILAGIL